MIYLDYAATAPVSEMAVDTISATMSIYGNPSSIHSTGRTSKKIVDSAKQTIADWINCEPRDIIFTSSGSEADNLALKGFYFAHPNDCTIITSIIEHKAILNTCEFLARLGCDVRYVSVDGSGCLDLEQLQEECETAKDNLLVSIQFANNEIGTIQNIEHISEITHSCGGVLHTDAVQMFPEKRIDVERYGIDMMSVSGHKFGCPKGIGFLYRRGSVTLEPLIHGGQQEDGLRAGTENVPYIAAMEHGVRRLQCDEINGITDKLREKRDYLVSKLIEIDGCICNGYYPTGLANNINISFKNVDGEALLLMLDANGICVSAGSACNSGTNEPSHVLKAIGVDKDYIMGTIRISIDNSISYAELDTAAEEIERAVVLLRDLR